MIFTSDLGESYLFGWGLLLLLIPENATFDWSLLHVGPFLCLEWFLAQHRRSCGLVCMLCVAPTWFRGVELLHVCSQLVGAKNGAIEQSWGYTMIIKCQQFLMIMPIFQAQLPCQLVTWNLKKLRACEIFELGNHHVMGKNLGATRSPTTFGSWECWWKKSCSSCFRDRPMQDAKWDMFHWYSDYQLINWIAEPAIYFGGWQTLQQWVNMSTSPILLLWR